MKVQHPAPVRIVIASDRPVSISRDGLRRLLETEPALTIVGETGGCHEAVNLVRELRADILLLDFDSNTRPALEALDGTGVRTIILTDSFDSPELMRALQLDARGIVLKSAPAELLFKGIQAVMAGHYWIAGDPLSDAATSVQRLQQERRRPKAFGLTERELEIIRAVVAGYTNREIAQRIAVTENTVKRHLTHIYDKLGASNRVELALFAAYHRLVPGTKSDKA